jgi:hypothetical protein
LIPIMTTTFIENNSWPIRHRPKIWSGFWDNLGALSFVHDFIYEIQKFGKNLLWNMRKRLFCFVYKNNETCKTACFASKRNFAEHQVCFAKLILLETLFQTLFMSNYSIIN